jgi:hypothetical protein
MKMNAKAFYEIITTLEQQGDIEPVSGTTQGRAGRGYRLVKDWSDAEDHKLAFYQVPP